jgi:hypothetical protein
MTQGIVFPLAAGTDVRAHSAAGYRAVAFLPMGALASKTIAEAYRAEVSVDCSVSGDHNLPE